MSEEEATSENRGLWGDSNYRDLLTNRAYIGDGFKTDYMHHVMCSAHPLTSVLCVHPKDEFSRKERFMTLVVVLGFATLMTAQTKTASCADVDKCCCPIGDEWKDPRNGNTQKCGTVQQDNSKVYSGPKECSPAVNQACLAGSADCENECLKKLHEKQAGSATGTSILVTIVCMILDSLMKTMAKCACCQGPSCPSMITNCAEWLGSRVMLMLFFYGCLVWLISYGMISSIADDSCRTTVWTSMFTSRIIAWLLSFVTAAIFFRGKYNKQKKEHEAYAAKFVEAGLNFGPVEGKSMFRAVAVCRNQYYDIDKNPDEFEKFKGFWGQFQAEAKPASPPTYEQMQEFETWIWDKTKVKIGVGDDAQA